jgi:hypothetical protein
MKIDNLKRMVLIEKLNYITAIFLIIGSIMLALFADDIFLGLNKWFWIIVLASLFIIPKILIFIMNVTYIQYSDEDEENKIIFRYIPQGTFKTQRRTIEIQKNQLAGIKIIDKLNGLRRYIIFQQKTNKGVANYPPVSLKGLSGSEIKALLKSLSEYVNNEEN